MQDFNRATIIVILSGTLLCVSEQTCFAGFGNMFGNESKSAAPVNAHRTQAKGNVDFSSNCAAGVDEPGSGRVRIVARIANAHKFIERGEAMMAACGLDHEKAEYKKGKVMKQIGEIDLADLKTKNLSDFDFSLDLERTTKVENPDLNGH